MKKFPILLFLLVTSTVFSQVQWMTLQQAVEAQANIPKKIIIGFYSDSSTSCKKMEKDTYNHPVIAQYLNDTYYVVKFDVESNDTLNVFGRTFGRQDLQPIKNEISLNDFAKFMSINTVPSTVFLDEQSMPITTLHGNLTAKELEPYLVFIGSDNYKKIDNNSKWENYRKKFKSKIKE